MTPAPVDHDARRAELGAVLFRLVDERGIEGVSIRALAAAAGVSIGTVQHYFPTKDALLRHGYEQVKARISARVAERTRGMTSHRDVLRALLLELLPLDAERRSEMRVATAFGIRALPDPALRRELAREMAELRDELTGMLAQAGVADPPAEAIMLNAVLDGLTDQLLFEALEPATALTAFDAALDRAFESADAST